MPFVRKSSSHRACTVCKARQRSGVTAASPAAGGRKSFPRRQARGLKYSRKNASPAPEASRASAPAKTGDRSKSKPRKKPKNAS
ncbi:hypothetical protein AW736_02210 [Termitidicoccus mucosus]|uniref:Uncharacterized protein n=1 Tax=Termitidicoccus mucosus TaxID=1184151 RepID=A0A178IP14_9BACT|nr:hypothetical protein AW736_02210 [Opitutaceae bacterium TSB47]